MGEPIAIQAQLAASVVDLGATQHKAIVLDEAGSVRHLRAYPLQPDVPQADIVKIATQQQGDAFERVHTTGADDRVLLPGYLDPTRVYRDDGTKLTTPNISKLNPVGFVGVGASAAICGTDGDAFYTRTSCFVDGVETFDETGQFLAGGARVLRILGSSSISWKSLATGAALEEPSFLKGVVHAAFAGTEYAVARRCVSAGKEVPGCSSVSGQDSIEWGEIPASFPSGKLVRKGRIAVPSAVGAEVWLTPRYVVVLGKETHLLQVIDRGARQIVLERAGIHQAAVNATHLIYAEPYALFARPWP